MTTTAAPAHAPAPAHPEPERESRVTPLELFFDLVFVFAITQVTGFLSADPSGMRLLQGVALIVVLWWAWSCYAWLGNTAASDDGVFRLVLLAAVGPMLLVSIAVPGAFGGDALLFGVSYLLVRILHLVAYWVLSREDAALRFVTVRLAAGMIPASALIALAGVLHGTGRTVCWAVAIAIELSALVVFGVDGWRVHPSHFAERHGLIVIIALGESIVALGVGARDHGLDAAAITGVLLGGAVAAGLWWLYFDIVVLVAERRFGRSVGADRARIARDSYTYLHLPMVAGIILFALGAKKTLGHVGEPLAVVPAIGLCGGVALYLLAHVLFRLRNIHRVSYARTVTAALLVAAVPLATAIPALVALGLVAAAVWALIVYERVRYADLRHRLRDAPA